MSVHFRGATAARLLFALLASGLAGCGTPELGLLHTRPPIEAGTWERMKGTYTGPVRVVVAGHAETVTHTLVLSGSVGSPRVKYSFLPDFPAKVRLVKTEPPANLLIHFPHSEEELQFRGNSLHVFWHREHGSEGAGVLYRTHGM